MTTLLGNAIRLVPLALFSLSLLGCGADSPTRSETPDGHVNVFEGRVFWGGEAAQGAAVQVTVGSG